MMMRNKENIKKTDREGFLLWLLYIVFIIASVAVILRVIYLQNTFVDSDPYIAKYYMNKSTRQPIEPRRGDIISSEGRLLATSIPMYQIFMDCTVRKQEFIDYGKTKGREKGEAKENEWRAKARELSKSLAAAVPEKSADGWYKAIVAGREKGNTYMKVSGLVDHATMLKFRQMPLFCEGGNKGGIIVVNRDKRSYPYGSLARRVIGYVEDGKTAKGLEGAYDYYLHGSSGYRWMRKSDKAMILDKDSSWVNATDGYDVRTTINIDLQDIADKSLRSRITDQPDIEGGCVMVMDVETGAICTMVNLLRDSVSKALGETYNLAIGRKGNPGSVFKTAILMSVMEDAGVKLSDEIPTDGGDVKIAKIKADDHVRDYERRTGKKTMSVRKGYEMSSNYIFQRLVKDNYASEPKKLIDNLYRYRLGEAFDFDLQGLATPVLPSPDSRYWTMTDLASVAIGYAVAETPLHILTFYNAIANKGRMMRPYIVESVEKDGKVIKKKGPSVLNGAVCSRAVADSLTSGLLSITSEGTAARLKDARLRVAGKTGTAWVYMDPKQASKTDPFKDREGRRKYQATFVGFFPAEQPKYTAIVVLYSYPTSKAVFGGSIPAAVYKDIVDNLYVMDGTFREVYGDKSQMPDIKVDKPVTSRDGRVPNVMGMGLKDALYAIENDGYRCSYSGCGHVVSQSPAQGTALKTGETVTLKLQ